MWSWPFSGSFQPLFQCESKCEVFVYEYQFSFISKIRTNYHDKNFALRLALKERQRGTRERPVICCARLSAEIINLQNNTIINLCECSCLFVLSLFKEGIEMLTP